MTRSKLLRTLLACLALSLLAACSSKDSADSTPLKTPQEALAAVAKEGKGFVVGAASGALTAYVLFDPQCPHCGQLWLASKPLQSKVKFVWMPVNFMGPKSAPQGAALLGASDPVALMNEHEASILAGTGGISAPSSVADEVANAIQHNTALLGRMGAESVPYVLAHNPVSGQAVARAGALSTSQLAAFIGLETPAP